jgi:hypothetical protein
MISGGKNTKLLNMADDGPENYRITT